MVVGKLAEFKAFKINHVPIRKKPELMSYIGYQVLEALESSTLSFKEIKKK